MFRGRFEHNIDSKGRVSLPAKYREILSTNYNDRIVITNYDSCLIAYPYEKWLALEENFKDYSIMQSEVEIFMHYFISGATECTLDKLGRILIPPQLRKHAGLEREIMFVGMITRIQIWDKQRWEKKFQESKNDFDQIKGKELLAKLGF